MISYASIDRIEGNIVVCEVERIPFYESNSEDFNEKETIMIEIPKDIIDKRIEIIEEGDILVLEHNNVTIKWVYYKDDKEKERRCKILKSFLI